MILRKPYAFLIKHFRLIHVILAILSCYSVYRTKILLDFFNEYASSMISIVGQDLTQSLIPFLYRLIPLLIIVLTGIVMVVMIVKDKPKLFYIINIGIYIFVFIIIMVADSTLTTMIRNLVDVRTIRLIRDFVMISFLVQLATIPIIVIRASGFDIKKFDFQQDLKDLEISEEDREEFEVNINVDKNRINRKFRRTKRYFGYYYKENKLVFSLIGGGSILAICVSGYLLFRASNPTLSQNTTFTANGFTMNVIESYLVNTDYEGNIIKEDYYYLILKTKFKNNTAISRALDTATTKVTIGVYYYIPILEYQDQFFDFGTPYYNEKIGNEFQDRILVYEIPKQLINNDMLFTYESKNIFDKNGEFQNTKIRIKYKDLTGINSIERFKLGNQMQLKNSILDDYKINITNYDIQKKYKLSYNYCISKECIKSYEYLTPTFTTNYDKVLLKITGTLEKETAIDKIYDLYDLIEYFGSIRYTIDGVTKTQNIITKEVKSKKTTHPNDYYIEVHEEVARASNITIVFKIRDRIYEYVLK